ncbi:unnamed protein product [Periconia digitata]|uniref:O-methyltransferase domain-containing protein n=1 Tax=Periconia digitata TaxID=1303443 RepID=A0A9W4XJ56_9PLEO|nr:unnamed protein product [Periconia digitata]
MDSTKSVSRLRQLADTISASVRKLEEGLSAKGIAQPSFDQDATFDIPIDLSTDHDAVLDATAELHDLLLEPLNLVHRHGGHNNSLCMQAIAEFKIADMVPLGGQVSFDEIATQTPMTTDVTARLLRHAMTMRLFREPEPGMVAHTAASRVLHKSAANDWLEAGTKEMWPAATKMVEALKKWPASEEANETGYTLANNGSETLYDVFAKNPEKATKWAKGMQVFTQRPQFDMRYLTDSYDWASLGKAQVVDIGGSSGHASIAIANRFPNLSFIVQDMEMVVKNATAPPDIQDRIRFMPYNLFTPQPVYGADVYFMRWIMHNWSDKYVRLMLGALFPALKLGARVIIQESLMPEPGAVALWKEKNLRATDMNMASAFNGKERTVVEFKSLVEKFEPALVLDQVIEPAGSALGMLVFVWGRQHIKAGK